MTPRAAEHTTCTLSTLTEHLLAASASWIFSWTLSHDDSEFLKRLRNSWSQTPCINTIIGNNLWTSFRHQVPLCYQFSQPLSMASPCQPNFFDISWWRTSDSPAVSFHSQVDWWTFGISWCHGAYLWDNQSDCISWFWGFGYLSDR